MPFALRFLAAVAVLGSTSCGDAAATQPRTIVFAAASLTASFQALEDAFEARHPGSRLELHFAGTPQLVGTRHPCVVWCQFWPNGTLAILGGVMGDDQMLEEFVPVVREIREGWFPSVTTLLQTADPAGSARNPHERGATLTVSIPG